MSIQTNVIANGLQKIITQYKDDAILKALLSAFLAIIQDINNGIGEVISKRLLVNATGEQLTIIGRLVGRGQGDLSEIDFKRAIRAQIRINKSNGTPEDIIEIAKLSADDASSFHLSEAIPHTLLVLCQTPSANFNEEMVFQNLLATKGHGIRLIFFFAPTGLNSTFTFAPGNVCIPSITRGFGNSLFIGTMSS